MKDITIEELAYLIKEAKENDQPQPIFFLGAGASVTGNIPLASEIEKNILKEYPDNPFIKKLDEKKKVYAKLMECLSPHQRNELLKKYVDEAKINVTHIYLAQLLKKGFVDYVLTVNFDNLMLRALALYNEFPSTYDMAILKDLTTTTFKEKSVVYLHGQYHGLWLLNTPDEMEKVKATVPRIFDSIKNKRPWIFIGYSANDPIFEYVKSLGRFDNGLYWVGYNEHTPAKSVQDFLNTANTNAFFIKGYDADAFMLKLNDSLGLEQPEILDKPFSSLQAMLENINDINDEEHFKGVKERLEIAKKDVTKSILQFEKKENVKIDKTELQVDKLKKEIIDILISKDYNEKNIDAIEVVAKKINNESVNSLLSKLYSSWGTSLGDLAENEKGKEADKLFQKSFGKFNKAIELKPDFHEAFNNWGSNLGLLAQAKKGKVAEELYLQACDKFNNAIEIKSDKHQTLYNLGTVLGSLAKLKRGKEADDLYHEAFEKFSKAIEIKPDKIEAYINWGSDLGELAKTKYGKEADDLFQQAFDKFNKAILMYPNHNELLNNWGHFLVIQARTKKGKEAEILYQQAFEKLNNAVKYGGSSYNLACFYALRKKKENALRHLNLTFKNKEIDAKFVEKDEDWREYLDDQDFKALLNKYS